MDRAKAEAPGGPRRRGEATAARMVLQLSTGETVEPARVEPATRLVVRASTAPPRP